MSDAIPSKRNKQKIDLVMKKTEAIAAEITDKIQREIVQAYLQGVKDGLEKARQIYHEATK